MRDILYKDFKNNYLRMFKKEDVEKDKKKMMCKQNGNITKEKT